MWLTVEKYPSLSLGIYIERTPPPRPIPPPYYMLYTLGIQAQYSEDSLTLNYFQYFSLNLKHYWLKLV